MTSPEGLRGDARSAILEFGDPEDPNGITCERVYFDRAGMLRRLGVM